ncbi:type II toxin-antitoxin system RelE/ParE family toxin [Sphingomonas beigongshangi]|uniref:type II toxin-antitoxin system RelE/ParE family toxin n=1 Tax=Sphingomonas beigongshangi TaxID=2782540 RepID=UPI00193B576A
MARFGLSRRATADLDAIYWGGADRFGLDQSEHYVAGLLDTLAFLADFPNAARLRLELDPPLRAHPYRSHLIVYEAVADGITVLRIPHARSDWATD